MVDSVEEGPAVVSEGVEVRGLDEAAVVIHIALNEVRDVGPVFVGQGAGGQGGEGEEGWVDGVEHVVFQGMGGRWGCCWRNSAMSQPVSVAEQKKAGLGVHPIWSAAGTTIMMFSSGLAGSGGRMWQNWSWSDSGTTMRQKPSLMSSLQKRMGPLVPGRVEIM